MTEKVIFFENTEDLKILTGLSEEELWSKGFNLDDMDFGIVTNKEWTDEWIFDDSPYYQHWLLARMGEHCAEYCHVKYKRKHYYTVHHA